MIKVKKFVSLLIALFLVLSNIAFAQYSNPNSYEGRPIDPSREGKDYYKDDVIVYPANKGSEEERMMERFAKSEMSEEEMRRIAKSKFGEDFDEMKFKRGMLEAKERMQRKEAFSYENEGYEQRYYIGPSYEGYSKEHMVFGMIFQHIGDDIDPREIKQHCNEPEKIADNVISKLKQRVGDLQNICSKAEEQEAKCQEQSKKMCSRMGTPFVREDATESEKLQSVAYSCPVNKDAIVKACISRNKANIEQNLRQIDESCKKRFEYEGERLARECERFKEGQVCDREKYMERCMGGIKKGENIKEENEELTSSATEKKCTNVPASCPTVSCVKGAVPYLNPKTCCPDCRPISIYPCPTYPTIINCETNYRKVEKRDLNDCEYAECEPCSTKYPVIDNCPPGEKLLVKIDANGCFYHTCRPEIKEGGDCPPIRIPQCKEDEKVSAGQDAQGCVFYYCQYIGTRIKQTNITISCPESSIPSCTSDQTLQKKIDDKGCIYYYCEATRVCPEPTTPSCSTGQILQKKTDGNGCVYYYCEGQACPTVQKPTCSTGETLQAYYDNAGCTTSYQCIKYQTTCPTVEKPTCAEGQSMTAKYDEKGCITGYECISVTTTSDNSITGKAVLSIYEDYLRNCENSWQQQEKSCASVRESCDKDAMVERCKQQSKKGFEEHLARTERDCSIFTKSEVRAVEDRCSRIDKERQRCSEESSKRCEQTKGVAEKCKETLTEENLRKFILEEAKKRCKFTDIVADEDDVKSSDKVEIVLAVLNTASESDIEKLELFIDGLKEDLKLQDTTVYKGMINPHDFGDVKLLPFVVKAKISAVASSERAKEVKAKIVARQKVEEAAGKLASLRDSDVPDEYLYIIEDKVSEVLDVSDDLKEIEKKEGEKGFGYKVKLFFGLAKKAEEVEIKQLGDSKEKLKNSIETLTKLVDEVPSDVAKVILKEQVENLKQQQADIVVLIETKERKAKGLLGLFG